MTTVPELRAQPDAAPSSILSAVAALDAGPTRVGGKAWGLARLRGALGEAATVPAWCVVCAEASLAHLGRADALETAYALLAGGPEPRAGTDLSDVSSQLTRLVLEAPVDPRLAAAIDVASRELGTDVLAVRSSMVGEDSSTASFAGQLESFLYVSPGRDTVDAVRKCWASAFSSHALAYRRSHGESSVLPAVAVVIQAMVTGEVSGVAFTAHPTTGRRDHTLVTANWGLAEGVVNGSCNTDEYVVDREGNEVEAVVADKDLEVVRGDDGTEERAVDDERRAARALTTAQSALVAVECVRVAESFGQPLDLEWTLVDGTLNLLQARPITALPAPENTSGPRVVFNNSNIQESYCGVTTPLTFSFAQAAYTSVYEQTMRAVGLGDDVVDAHRGMLRNMIGMVRGRVYYNINNWYRGLLLLPSFGRNKEDMEAMMGLDVPVDFVEDQRLTTGEKLARLPAMLATVVRLLGRFRALKRDVPKFLSDFEAAYERVDRGGFATASFSELIGTTEQMRVEMLENWATPIINDTYVMMTVGRLRRLVASAGVENPAEVVNNIMSGEEGIESLEPTRTLMRIARDLRSDSAAGAVLRDEEPLPALSLLRKEHPAFGARIDAYIERYGDRVIGELKLETITAREDPTFVMQVLRNYLDRDDLDPDALAAHERELRSDAERQLRAGLGAMGRMRAPGVLRAARTAVKYRENMRLARTRMFGLYRDAYRAIGDRLFEAGVLAHPRDVFYLGTNELLAYHEGRSISADLGALAEARKAEFAAYEKQDLAHHFETIGPVYHGNRYRGPDDDIEIDSNAEILQGTGCYPGVVSAPLRVVMSPADNLDLEGRILTTLRTDPGWAPLFPAAAGILVERGSTLSHSAVVARELGIPAVVGVPGLLKIVADGEDVVLDGGAGTVRRGTKTSEK